MWKIAIKDLLAHKLRSLLVVSIIMVGVAFISGSMILTNTVTKTFDDIFGDAFANVDVVVRGSGGIDGGEGMTPNVPVDQSYVNRLAAIDGVSAAEGISQGSAQLLGKDGDTLPGGGFAPEFGSNWIKDGKTNAFQLREGRAPQNAGEIVIDAGLADVGKYKVNDKARVLEAGGTNEYTVVGIAGFGNASSPGGTRWVFYETAHAQQVLGQVGKFSEIDLQADEGFSDEELRERVESRIGPDLEVITGEQAADELQQPLGDGFAFVKVLLLVFAGISLLVSAFVINNVFSILVAQRTKQLAMLRSIGARASRVLTSVLLEGFVIGVAASVLGLGVGLGIATGLIVLINSFGLGNGVVSPIVDTPTFVTAMLAGTIITMLASIVPAVKAARVPPLAAMRDVAFEKTKVSKRRVATGFLFLAGGGGVIALGIGDDSTPIAGLGCALVFLGVALLTATIARPIVKVIGWPIAKFRGAQGTLARENVRRTPRRASATALALTLGVTLVTLFTIVFSSIQASVNDQIDRTFTGDLVVQGPQNGIGGIPIDLATRLDALPQTDQVAATRLLPLGVNGAPVYAQAVTPGAYQDIFKLKVLQGDFKALDDSSVAVADSVATSNGWSVGQVVPVQFADGGSTQLKVAAIVEGNQFSGGWFVTTGLYDKFVSQKFDAALSMTAADGVDIEQLKAVVEPIVDTYPNAELQDLASVKEQVNMQIGIALNVLYGLLGLAVIVALVGIATTLSLSVVERTREIGLLRAIGMTRGKVRATIRWESVLVAVFGAAIGVLLGTGFALVVLETMADDGITVVSVPPAQLAIIVGVAMASGVLAAVWPARRASKLNILDAIASE